MLSAAVCTVLVFAAVMTLVSSENAVNNFTAESTETPTVNETFTDNIVKKEVTVSVGKTGYSVYVRAAVVVTWQDKNGNTLSAVPTLGTDYSLELNTADWTEGADGYYYYNEKVKSNGTTKVLIESCKQENAAPEKNYSLHVGITAQTVQAAGTTSDGETAKSDAWGKLFKAQIKNSTNSSASFKSDESVTVLAADPNETVTFTLPEEDGYSFTVSAADESGDKISLTKTDSGYSFTMPSGNVNITVTEEATDAGTT